MGCNASDLGECHTNRCLAQPGANVVRKMGTDFLLDKST